MSDKTRTLEQQYTGLLIERLRLETKLVEEDYNSLLIDYNVLASKVKNDESKHKDELDSLRSMIDQLFLENTEKSRAFEVLMEEKKMIACRIKEMERRGEEDVAKKDGDGFYEVIDKNTKEGIVKIDEVLNAVRSIEDNLRKVSCEFFWDRSSSWFEKVWAGVCALEMKGVENTNRVLNVVGELKEMREAEIYPDVCGVDVTGNLMKVFKDEMMRLTNMFEEKKEKFSEDVLKLLIGLNSKQAEESSTFNHDQRLIVEKGNIMNVPNESVKQKAEIINAQQKLPEEVIPEVSSVRYKNIGDPGEYAWVTKENREVVVTKKKYNTRKRTPNLDEVPTTPASQKRKKETHLKDRGDSSSNGRTALKEAHKNDVQENRMNKAEIIDFGGKQNKTEPNERDTEVVENGQLFIPGSLLIPENTSYFADLTFNNSSPAIKRDRPPHTWKK